MSGDNQLVIAAIEGLRGDMNERFRDLNSQIERAHLGINKRLAEHDTRLTTQETWMTRVKAVTTAMLVMFGPDGLHHVKAWLTALKP